MSPDGTRVAWAFDDGDHWSVINSDVAGEEAERPWTTVPDGAAGSTVGTIGFVSDDETIFVDNGESSLAVDKSSSNVSLLTGHRHHSRVARTALR